MEIIKIRKALENRNKIMMSEKKEEGEKHIIKNIDELYGEAIVLVRKENKASSSFLQRRFRIGYARAVQLLDMMEKQGIVGPANGSEPREVYSSKIT